jgi:hypothetical protein
MEYKVLKIIFTLERWSGRSEIIFKRTPIILAQTDFQALDQRMQR